MVNDRVKLSIMSKSIVDIMKEIANNTGVARLLMNNTNTPYNEIPENIEDIANINSKHAKIYPFPFNPDAEIKDGSFIRVYYNYGELDSSETISDLDIYIDIVVAKSLWLISDANKSLIRPYEILGRVIDTVGRRSGRNSIRIEVKGFQHLSVNNSFDAIRIYCKNMSVESQYNDRL